MSEGKIAVILIRGTINAGREEKETLNMLNLRKKHSCVVLDKNPVNTGMVKKCKDYVAYGEISPETLEELKKKRGKEKQKHYALHPPRGGFGRVGTKKAHAEKGSLGNLGEKINDLIKRMI